MENICFFNTTRFWGGGEKFNFEYALGFKENGYKVIVVCKNGAPLSKKSKQKKIAQFNITIKNLSFLNPFKLIKLIRFFKNEKIDTVILSSSPDLKLGAFAAKLAGVQKIVYRRGLAAPIKNKFLNRYILSKILTHIFANSIETKKTILQNLAKYLDADKIEVIHNGIDINKTAIKQPHKFEGIVKKQNGIVLGNMGRLSPQKSQDHLIKIAKILKEKKIAFTLFIAGTGPLKEKLESMIQEYNLQEEVILLDFVEDIENFMFSIDIFLLTSQWEGFGYVLAEAMIMEKAVVAYNITSNPEIVKNNSTGYLVEYNDIENFANKIEILASDKNIREDFGKAGKKRVIENFQYKDQIKKIEQFLNTEK